MLDSSQVRPKPQVLEQSKAREPTMADQDSRFLIHLSGLLDVTLAGFIGILGLEFVDGQATFDLNHMIAAGLLGAMGVVTIWYGRDRAPKAEDEATSVFKVEG